MTRDEARRALVKAAGDQGYANGLDGAAKVLRTVADNSTRVVGTNTLKDLAEAMERKANRIRAAASATVGSILKEDIE
jgi:hypothetical protein